MCAMGVYRIRNLNTGKCYVGASTDVEKRLRQHYSWLRDGCHWNYKLQGAANKSGLDNLAFEPVERVSSRAALATRELEWMKMLNAVDGGYNISWDTEHKSWGGARKKRRQIPHEIAVCAAIVVAVLFILAA